MPKIAILPQHLANKIAAGEVIERPASVVKELLENSIDSGAQDIQIDIEDGGKKLIQITDNGSGIDQEDLVLAVTPHATSKIKTDDDLFAISSFGFRGEALASIASVSQMEITSCTSDNHEGAKLEITGPEIDAPIPAGAKKGTVISVRNLFYNTPARRKFLRTTNTEMSHISEQFTRIAMANPSIHLTLTHNGRTLHDLAANQPLRERIGKLFSRDLTDNLIPIHRNDRDIEISGLIAPPQHSRVNTQWQYIFLNNRYIRDRFIGHAIKESYRGLMEINRSPIVFLFIQIAPDQVDVNVHPAKAEVRFADSNAVHSQVLAAIRDKLLSSDYKVKLNLEHAEDKNEESDSQTKGDRQEKTRQAMVDFFKNNSPNTTPSSQHAVIPKPSHFTQQAEPVTHHSQQPKIINNVDVSEDDETIMDKTSQQPRDVLFSEMPVSQIDYIQIHNSYLVTETDEGLMIVDQHALHERYMFEQLWQQSTKGPLESQRCLIPETLDVTEEQMACLQDSSDLMEKLGIIVEQFGPKTVAIQGFPILLDKLSPKDFLADLLDLLIEQVGHVSQEQAMHKILDMMSCKAAIKAGDSLTPQEIKELLIKKDQVERSNNCPHGRPTSVHLSLKQLEKEFKRT